MGKMITIQQYADLHGRSRKTIWQKVKRGGFKTAEQVAPRLWMINEDEPYIDDRIRTPGKNNQIPKVDRDK